MTQSNERTANYPIDSIFLERWSPRAFTGEAIARDGLFTMFEAARWAPSSYNSQPWRFVYALRETPAWEKFLGLLHEFNRSWCKDAAALVIMVSNSVMRPPGSEQEVPSHSHSFDVGTSSGFLALQAIRLGWHVHGMVGFDLARAFAELNVPPGHRVEAAFAIGRRADKSKLPPTLQARELPSQRRPLAEWAFEGTFEAKDV